MHYFVISEANQAQVMIRLRPSHGTERLIREMKLFFTFESRESVNWEASEWMEHPCVHWIPLVDGKSYREDHSEEWKIALEPISLILLSILHITAGLIFFNVFLIFVILFKTLPCLPTSLWLIPVFIPWSSLPGLPAFPLWVLLLPLNYLFPATPASWLSPAWPNLSLPLGLCSCHLLCWESSSPSGLLHLLPTSA